MPRDDDEALAQEREWRAIVENYGERPTLEQDDVAPAPEPPAEPAAEEPQWFHAEEQDEGFVPPAPPPVERPPADRLAAWFGVLGVPVLVIVCVAADIALSSWALLLLAAAFVGGFLYLVLRLPASPTDPSDDGARL